MDNTVAAILKQSLLFVREEIQKCPSLRGDYNKKTAIVVRDIWVRSLRLAFAQEYRLVPDIAIFGGRPESEEARKEGLGSGMKGWSRWEFLYDVAVLSQETVSAAYARDPGENGMPKELPIVKHAVWLVESEFAKNGSEVAIDASKLRIARSQNTLFVAAQTSQRDKTAWLGFLGKVLRGIEGNVYLAIMPSYSSNDKKRKNWLDGTLEVLLYRCSNNVLPQEVCAISLSSETGAS